LKKTNLRGGIVAPLVLRQPPKITTVALHCAWRAKQPAQTRRGTHACAM